MAGKRLPSKRRFDHRRIALFPLAFGFGHSRKVVMAAASLLLSLAVVAASFAPLNADRSLPALLTDEERSWLQQNPDKRVLWFNTQFPPIEYAAPDGRFAGMGADILALVEERLGFAFLKRPSDDWNAHLHALESGECAVAPTIVATPERERFGFFTSPYATVPVVIITGNGLHQPLTLEALAGRRVAVVSGYATEGFLRRHMGNRIEVVPMPDVPHGLRAAAFGQVDAFVENLAVAAFYIEAEGIPNLRVAGTTPYSFAWSIGVSRHYPLLYSAVQKALAAIPTEDIDRVRRRWITLEIESGLSPATQRLLFTTIAFITLLVLGLGGISYALRKRLREEVSNLKAAQQKVLDQTELLQLATEATQTQAGIWDIHPLKETAFLSKQWFGMLGYEALEQEISLKGLENYIHPDDLAGVLQAFQDYISLGGQGLYEHELRLRRADGSWCWVLSKGRMVRWDAEGRPLRLIGLDINIQNLKEAQEKMARSEAKLRAIFEHAPYAIVVNRLEDGRFLDANQIFLRNRKVDKTELLQLGARDFAYMSDAEAAEVIETLKKSGSVRNREVTVDNGDGSTSHLIYSAILLDMQGQRQVLSMIVDVTERKRAEKALQENMELLKATFNATSDGILVVDQDLRISQANRQFYTMWRIPPDLQQTQDDAALREFVENQLVDPAGFQNIVRRLYDGQMQEMYELAFKDGRVFECYTAPVLLADQAIGRVWDFRDISSRKATQRAIDFERRQLLSIFDSMDEMIYVADPHTHEMLFANRRLRDLLGKDPTGERCYEVLQGYDKPCEFCTNAIILGNNGQPYRWEHHNPVSHIDVDILDQLIRWPDGRDVRLEIAVDISDRKQVEAEREELQGQLLQSQKLEAVGNLAGGVAHDFNNMLGAIIGYAELTLTEMAPDNPLRKHLVQILEAARRSAALTRQLLAFARRQTIAPVVFDLNEAVEGILKMLRRLIGEDIDLAWLPATGPCSVKLDPAQLDQILTNLCVNARDAIADVGRITIETDRTTFDEAYCDVHAGFTPGEYVMLAVSDNGCGMEKETLPYIFDPFFTTKAVGQGTGLGLATVYGIVKQNDGFINVYSEPAKGTTFIIYLPLQATQAGDADGAGAADIMHSNGETILLVEDDAVLLQMGTLMLQRLGYRVLPAASPGEALRLAEESHEEIHLFITDVVMPEMNGRQLAERLQAIRPGIEHLFMSGYTKDVIAHRGILDEGVNFIQKPFTTHDLSAKIRDVLEGQ